MVPWISTHLKGKLSENDSPAKAQSFFIILCRVNNFSYFVLSNYHYLDFKSNSESNTKMFFLTVMK
jgi:hypothetical protein